MEGDRRDHLRGPVGRCSCPSRSRVLACACVASRQHRARVACAMALVCSVCRRRTDRRLAVRPLASLQLDRGGVCNPLAPTMGSRLSLLGLLRCHGGARVRGSRRIRSARHPPSQPRCGRLSRAGSRNPQSRRCRRRCRRVPCTSYSSPRDAQEPVGRVSRGKRRHGPRVDRTGAAGAPNVHRDRHRRRHARRRLSRVRLCTAGR
jgi:hypothetical protein